MQELILNSPAHGDPCVYYWPLDDKARGEGALEIVETIKWVCDDFPEMKLALDNHILSGCDLKSYESMKVVCDRFNRVIASVRQMRAGTSLPVSVPTRPSAGLLRHIIQKAYNHAVTDPDKLNNYEPFSPEVYGETSFEFIMQMVDQISITENDVFIDLGSGVGQVVLQIAASTKAKKCIGIEKAEVPALYAQQLEKSFKFWMRWYGKVSGDYELVKGDFFEDKYREIITNASFIFVNNFAFGPNVDHMLKLLFADLKDGARIVSSKSFCPSNFRITDRNLSDIATILHVREIQPIKGSVSWTGKPVSYYHHIVDRRKLEDYFLNMRGPKKYMNRNQQNNSNNNSNNKDNVQNISNNNITVINNKDEDEIGRAIKNNCTDSSSSDDSNQSFKDSNHVGPTTRKAWSEYCNTKYRENSNSSSGNTQQSSSSETGYHSASQVTSNSTANIPNRPGRPRKYGPGVAAVVRRANKNKANSEGRRRPGRPRKDGIKSKKNKRITFNGLDLLHAQTVLSISNSSGVKTGPAPGCVDQKLDTIKKSMIPPQSTVTKPPGLGFGQFNSEIKNSDLKPKHEASSTFPTSSLPINDFKPKEKQEKSMAVVPDFETEESENKPLNDVNSPEYKLLMDNIATSFDNLFEEQKRQFMSFILLMQTRNFKNDLLAEIESEKRKRSYHLAQVEILERTVNGLREKGVNFLKSRLSELDITASTSEELVTKAREIICLNKDLQEQVNTYQDQVKYLENLNSALKRHKSYDNLMHVNTMKTNRGIMDTNSLKETANQKANINTAIEKNHSDTFLVKDVHQPPLHLQRQPHQNQHQQPPPQPQHPIQQTVQTNRAQFQANVGPCRLLNIEERMKKMIVAALNDNKDTKKESRKRSKSFNDNKNAKVAPRCDGIYDFDDDEPPNVTPETDYPSRLKDASKLAQMKDVSVTSSSSTGQSKKGSDPRSSNKASNSFNNPPSEDKKPILLTFKIDRRDNSAIVTSPSISPEKSPSKASKEPDVNTKKKHFSPERVKKSRSPKYSSIVPETNGSEKRPSLIIKFNHSSIHINNHTHDKLDSNVHQSNLKNEKPLDVSNRLTSPALTSSSSSRYHHNDQAIGSHKWQATISNSFDKLVKLAHQLDQST